LVWPLFRISSLGLPELTTSTTTLSPGVNFVSPFLRSTFYLVPD
jgi:hypothetical protein